MQHWKKFRRQTHRLVGYDYRQEGLYFITICTKDMEHFFGEVCNGEVQLSAAGIIAQQNWLAIPEINTHTWLHEFVVMPNHVHGIVEITEAFSGEVVIPAVSSLSNKNPYMASISPKTGSISRIISRYKAACTSMIRSLGIPAFTWQARFHDHIIRTPQSHARISQYILHNPQRWAEDCYNLPPSK